MSDTLVSRREPLCYEAPRYTLRAYAITGRARREQPLSALPSQYRYRTFAYHNDAVLACRAVCAEDAGRTGHVYTVEALPQRVISRRCAAPAIRIEK